ncbi:MAG: hypothetical protein WA005_01805 [Candidatus Binataceae bacterium]
MLLLATAIMATLIVGVESPRGQDAEDDAAVAARLGLSPDAPRWARWASGNVRLRFTQHWRGIESQMLAGGSSQGALEPFLEPALEPPLRPLVTVPTPIPVPKAAAPVVFNLDTTAMPQNGGTIIEDPTGGGRIVSGYNDYRGLINTNGDFTGWSISTNSAAAVAKDGQAQPLSILSSTVPSEGDPVLSFDLAGDFFLASLAFGAAQNPSAVVVYRSPNAASGNGLFGSGCAGGDANPNCWTTAKIVDADNCTSSGGNFLDREWMAVDRSTSKAAGMVYVTWTQFACFSGASASAIQIAKCSNNLANCTAPLTLDSTTGLGSPLDFLQNSYVTVGLDGTVFVAWVKHAGESASDESDTIRLVSIAPSAGTSSVGTVGTIQTVFTENSPIPYLTAPFPANHDEVTYPVLLAARGLFAFWARRTPGSPILLNKFFLSSNIVESTSTDGGTTWLTNPKLVSNAANTQYQPSACVNNNNEIEVAYYSSQRDPAGHKVDAFLATSTHPAAIRLTPLEDTTEADPVLSDAFFGDHTGISCASSHAYVEYTGNYVAKPTYQIGGNLTTKVPQQDNFVTTVTNP